MEDEPFVDKVVARALAMLAGEPVDLSPRNVLMLFSGASTGFVVGMEAIRRLTGSPHTLTVVLTPAACQIITEAQVRQAGATAIIKPGEWANTPELVGRADLVLVPTLSMNLAAHLALGLMDSPVATLTLGALLAGRPVLAIRDGADPNGGAGQVFGAADDAAPALRARLASHLDTLASYGVELVGADEFLLALERRLLTRGTPQPLAQPAARTSNGLSGQHAPGSNGARAGFVTETEILALAPGSALRLAPGSRLTPQAQDTAKRLGLILEQV